MRAKWRRKEGSKAAVWRTVSTAHNSIAYYGLLAAKQEHPPALCFNRVWWILRCINIMWTGRRRVKMVQSGNHESKQRMCTTKVTCLPSLTSCNPPVNLSQRPESMALSGSCLTCLCLCDEWAAGATAPPASFMPKRPRPSNKGGAVAGGGGARFGAPRRPPPAVLARNAALLRCQQLAPRNRVAPRTCGAGANEGGGLRASSRARSKGMWSVLPSPGGHIMRARSSKKKEQSKAAKAHRP